MIGEELLGYHNNNNYMTVPKLTECITTLSAVSDSVQEINGTSLCKSFSASIGLVCS